MNVLLPIVVAIIGVVLSLGARKTWKQGRKVYALSLGITSIICYIFLGLTILTFM